ncbi:MAG: TlpA disulfide reductase family protein [Woeseiaceae bacterium]
MKKTFAIAILMIAIAAAGYLMRAKLAPVEAPVATGSPSDLPLDFTLPDLEGRPRQLSEWRGEVLLVNFWATWCAPCRREIPLLKSTQAAQAEKRLQVIGVAVDYLDDVTAYAEDAAFNYPILIGQQDAIAAAESSGIEFVGMPFTLVVSTDGRLIKAHLGEIVAEHIDSISAVAVALQSGEMDFAAAKQALQEL